MKPDYEPLFSKYEIFSQNDLKGNTVMNYVSSHDDGWPFDKKVEKHLNLNQIIVCTRDFSNYIMVMNWRSLR
jgi:hypothetical protein